VLRTVFGTPKRFHTLLKKGSSGFYIEPWGSILGQEPFTKTIVLYRTILEFHEVGDGTISGSK